LHLTEHPLIIRSTNKVKTQSKFLLVIVLLSSFLLALGLIPQAQAQGGVVLALVPATQTVQPGVPFDVTVEVRAGAQPVDNAAAYLNFDPSVLQVVSSTPGSALQFTLQNTIDNPYGHVDLAQGTVFGTYVTGTFTLATVRFNAIANTAGTEIVF